MSNAPSTSRYEEGPRSSGIVAAATLAANTAVKRDSSDRIVVTTTNDHPIGSVQAPYVQYDTAEVFNAAGGNSANLLSDGTVVAGNYVKCTTNGKMTDDGTTWTDNSVAQARETQATDGGVFYAQWIG